jgi:hypothetical protein
MYCWCANQINTGAGTALFRQHCTTMQAPLVPCRSALVAPELFHKLAVQDGGAQDGDTAAQVYNPPMGAEVFFSGIALQQEVSC